MSDPVFTPPPQPSETLSSIQGSLPPESLSPGLGNDFHREQLTVRRRQKRQQVWIGRLQQLVKISFAVALCLLLYQAMRSFPLSANGQVEWLGPTSQLVSSDAIEQQLSRETSFFLLDVRRVARELQDRFPLLNHVVVRRRFFPQQSLMVSVSEKPLWGMVYRNPSRIQTDQLPMFVVSSDNLIFPVSTLTHFVQYRQAHSHTLVRLLIPGSRQEMMTAFQLAQLRELASTLSHYPSLSIHYIDLSLPNQLTLVNDGPAVYLGRLDETWPRRLDRLKSLLPHWPAWSGNIKAVDLRWEHQVTLHPVLTKK